MFRLRSPLAWFYEETFRWGPGQGDTCLHPRPEETQDGDQIR